MMYVELSHRLSVDAPLPPGVPTMQLQHHYSIERGDVSNLFVLQLSNHSGTHIDAPWHFVASGLRICDFRLEEFVFERPLCIDVAIGDGGLLERVHFEPHAERLGQADLLLVRTGYARVRRESPERYTLQSPGMSIHGAHYLADHFSRLRAIGLDTISLASMQHLEEGLEAHRILFRGDGRRFLIIEDMNLDFDLSQLRRVIALPLFIEGVDSSFSTVMGITGRDVA
ncbi:MAG: cyclase family protein [Acidobacteriia bacterium]|nr:cyclase family protein [Terriglobia bacterium]